MKTRELLKISNKYYYNNNGEVCLSGLYFEIYSSGFYLVLTKNPMLINLNFGNYSNSNNTRIDIIIGKGVVNEN